MESPTVEDTVDVVRRVAVRVAYQGHMFYGSQRQPGLRTVESDVLHAIERVSPAPRPEPMLKAASRTDSGVSSTGNVMAFWTSFTDDRAMLRALNAVSKDVHFLAATEVPPDRNIRRANCRSYRYLLPKEGLDIDDAEQCARLFEGKHDFRRFCRDDGKGTVMTLERIEVTERETLVLDFHSRRFLWHLIRRIVAAIEAVGTGRASLSDVESALDGEDLGFGLADPRPLTLISVRYDDLQFGTFSDPVLYRKIDDALHRARCDMEFHNLLS